MACFSLAWFEQLLIWLVIICAVIAILKLLVPYVLSQIGVEMSGGASVVMRAISIAIWAVVVIFVIVICFSLVLCLLGYSGGLPLLPRR